MTLAPPEETDVAQPETLATGPLIDHILSRYHETHRADLPELCALADRVEQVHADDPDVPTGLALALTVLTQDMESHMAKEEQILFPAMRAGGMPGIQHPIRVMRADHDDHDANIARIRKLTHNLTPPPQACGSWRRLYAGIDQLFQDLNQHIALENDVLFARFETR